MIHRRTHFTKTREEFILFCEVMFLAVPSEFFQKEDHPFRMLMTGGFNSGKTLGLLTALLTLSDDRKIEELLADTDKKMKMYQGEISLEIGGVPRSMVFKHGSLAQLRPCYEDLLSKAAQGGLMFNTAPTAKPYYKLTDHPVYYDAFKKAVSQPIISR